MAPSFLERALPPALGLTGALLGVVTLAETAVMVGGQYPVNVPFVAGLVTSVPFVCLLVVGARRLRQGVVSTERFQRITGWTVASTVFFGAFFTVVAVFFFETVWDRVGVLRWGLAVGVGSGFLTGYTNARTIDRAVAAERSAIRAEQAAERRELLTYLHALLRHEVLNSVTAIEGHATVLDSTLPEDVGAERVEVIQRQCRGLSRVIEDVKFLLDATNNPADTEPVDLVPILEAELTSLHDRFERVETERDLPETLVVEADTLVGHLFENLVRNAVEHNDAERPRVSVAATRDEDTVTVVVADDGPGLPDAVAENPLDTSSNMRADYGLGLAIVYRLVDRYGGTIDIETPDDGGTRVEVTLPRSEDTPGSAPGGEATSPDLIPPESPDESPLEARGSQPSESDE